MILFKLIANFAFCLFLLPGMQLQGQGPAKLPPPSGIAVFTIVFEAKATGGDGTSASSKVEVRFAPGAEWHGYFGTNFSSFGRPAEDTRTPSGLYKLRGGLYGLRPSEPMCFGILSHKGSASAGGRTINGPGAGQMDSAGTGWSLREDAARFTRTEAGGVLRLAPVTYQEEEPPEFALMSPGAYDFDQAGKDSYERLMNFRFSNEELKNLKKVKKVNEASLTSTDGSVRQWYKMTLTAEPPGDETEVTVEPEGFDDWIPEGNLDKPGERGNRLKIRFTAAKKDDPSVKRKVKLDLTFSKVSMEKGVCMNWPAAGGKSDYGLRFLEKENPELEVLGPDHARTKEPVESLNLVVTAHDFGAWGTLHITAKDEEGAEAKVKIRGEDMPDLAIPKDDNHNHIADAWETKWAGGLRGQETDDEDAQPVGDGHSGDALSLYEEYRGFKISGGGEATDSGGRPQELITGYHVRTNPRVKDVFICDTLGLGIGAFRASGLQVHLMKAAECGSSQGGAFNTHIVNANRGSYSKGEQYVLWMEAGDVNGNYVGEAIMKAGPSVPRDCQKVRVRPAVADPAKAISPEETRVTLTHELAHACNVKHHGDGNFQDVVKVEYLEDQTDGKGNVLNPKGKVVEDPSGSWSLAFESGSQASGDTHCYMGYTANFVRDSQGPMKVWYAGGSCRARQLNPGLDRYTKTRFCDAAAGFELGPAGPPDKGRGDCLHKFCVNHLKH